MKLYLSPNPKGAPDNNGIGRIVHAQYRYLPKLGIQILDKPDRADVIASHVRKGSLSRIDVLHCHGLYMDDLPHAPYDEWHYRANKEIIESAREAEVITVPSAWVAMPFQRDMRISPAVIGHGIDFSEWKPGVNGGYVLWNKNRNTDVCDPAPAYELAKKGVSIWSTFLPLKSGERPTSLKIIGTKSFLDMKKIVENADIYLATTPETFGIGTVEAMAAGVPILGYEWAGTADIVEHKITGYLVSPGDVNGLMDGVKWLRENRNSVSERCREFASEFDWQKIMPQYVTVYDQAMQRRSRRTGDTTIVITSYNYGGYVADAVKSAIGQSEPPKEIIVIDDGSTDNTADVMKQFESEPIIDGKPLVRYIKQNNQGVAAARNNGIALAKTEFVTCLDADDRIAPNFVRILGDALRKDKGMGIAYSGLSFIQKDGSVKPYSAWPPKFSWGAQSEVHNPPGNCIPSACLFRKGMWERSGGYEQQYAPGEDAHFWTKSLALGFTARKVSEDGLHQYRAHEGSASRTKTYRAINEWLPWMGDKKYPMGAPVDHNTTVNSYFMPGVSVIIPVGPGHEKYLPIAIESLVGQTFRNWEVIVIDDTGGSELKKYIRMYPFIRLLETSGKTGAGAARNVGLKVARGDTVFFLDADDYIAPNSIDDLVRMYNEQGGENCYIYSDWFLVKGNETPIPVRSPDYNESETKFQHPVSVLMNRKTAQKYTFDEDLKSWEDWTFFIKARMDGVCGKRLPKNLLYYAVDKGNRAESLKSKKGMEVLNVIRKRYKDYFGDRRKIMGCGSCGPGGNAIIQQKQAMGLLPKERTVQNTGNTNIKMVFIGEAAGTRTYTVNGVAYRAGNNATAKYVLARPQDVDKLIATGMFDIVVQPKIDAPAPVSTPTPAVVVPVQSKELDTWEGASSSFDADIQAAKSVKSEKDQPQSESYNKPLETAPMPSTLKEIKAALSTATMEDLFDWMATERGADKPRTTVVTAIQAELDRR